MKKNYALLFVITLLLSKTTTTNAQVNVQDSLVLVNLYNSTDGPHWKNNTGWLTTTPVSKWFGIVLLGDRVQGMLLYKNQLHGSIPPSIGDLTYLGYVYLNNNQLNGTIPPALGNLTKLSGLDLSYNQLSGSIPPELSNIPALGGLNLSHNRLTGNIPKELASISYFFALDLSYNQLTGVIPPEITGAKLEYLYLNNNQLSGSIPEASVYLNSLNLSHNQLTGGIPEELGQLAITFLNLGYNQLTGNIPSFEGAKASLRELNLQHNQLTGAIPHTFGKLQKLRLLNLRSNYLVNGIPGSLGKLKQLQTLFLTRNKLTGSIPDSFANLKNLTVLHLGANRLIGPLPSFLTQLPNLKKLNILHNFFTFDGLETLSQHKFDTLRYYVQRYIHLHNNKNVLSVYAGGTLSNNTYIWFKDGALVATIKGDSTFTPTNSGNYNVWVTNSIATQLTLQSDTLFYSGEGLIANNIHAQNYNTTFSIYPNPAKTTVTVTFNATGNCTLKLTDAEGKVLQTKTVMAVEGANNIQLDISRYTSGVYFVTMTDEQNRTQTLQLSKL